MMAVELSKDQVTEYMQEIKDRSRFVAIGDSIIVLQRPTNKIKTDARIVYAKTLTFMLKEGIPCRADMRVILKDKIVDSGKDPMILERREAIAKKLVESLSDLDEALAPEALLHPKGLLNLINKTTAKLTQEERQQMEELAAMEDLETALLSNSAEVLAAAERDLYLLHRCVFTDDGRQLWPDFDALHNEFDTEFTAKVQEEFQRFMIGLPMLFEVVMPEGNDIKNSQGQ